MISGHVSIGKRSFIGVNSAVKTFVKLVQIVLSQWGQMLHLIKSRFNVYKSGILNSKDRKPKFIIKKYFFMKQNWKIIDLIIKPNSVLQKSAVIAQQN